MGICFGRQCALKLPSQTKEGDASTIARVLEDDDILARVLNCLVEDSLQECRLVCRRWRDVCRTLPVSVRAHFLSDVTEWADKFPNAESLAFSSLGPSINSLIPKSVVDTKTEKSSLLDASYLWNIARFTCLKHLSLSYLEDVSAGEMENCFRQLTQLESFKWESLHCFANDSIVDLVYLPQYLCHWTRLTKFCWIAGTARHPVCEPLTSLRKIKELNLTPNILTTEAGDLLFPSMTSLEKISFSHLWSSDVKHLTEITNVLLPYSTSLRSLEFCKGSDTLRNYGINKSCITSFPLLEYLSLPILAVDDGTDFVDHILGMEHLTELKLRWPDQHFVENCVRLSALSKLEALTLFSGPRASIELNDVLRGLTQLTRLSVSGAILRDMSSLKYLTALVNLSLNGNSPFTGELVEVLSPLKRLAQLAFRDPTLQFPSEAVKHMSNLRALSLGCRGVDDSFGCTLALLPQLTSLSVDGPVVDVSFLTQINKIKNLVDLHLLRLPDLSNFPVLDGNCLPKLRYLNIGARLSSCAISKIEAALPCLRRLTLPDFFD